MPSWKRNLYVCWFGSFVIVAGMNLSIPFLPVYIEQLGHFSVAEIEIWSGLAFGAAYLVSAIVSPIWGRMADRYGRKPLLLRSSLGMAITTALTGLVSNVYQLMGMRLLTGAISGYYSAAVTLVASQTPKEHAGWALGTFSTSIVSGTLLGPIVGGYLAEILGLRNVFFITGAMMFVGFIFTALFVKEEFMAVAKNNVSSTDLWGLIPDPAAIRALFICTLSLTTATLTIEPIITVYVTQLNQSDSYLTLYSGAVVSASGLANVMSASYLGKVSDRIGPEKVLLGGLIASTILLIPQAFVQNIWQLIGLRFLAGIAIAALLPSINSLIRRSVPTSVTARIFAYNQSYFMIGNIMGPLLGGIVAARLGIPYVFYASSLLLMLTALWIRLRLAPSHETSTGK
ncbi:MFS transporter [Heliobacterium undosum]|uniref:MFS transporter n=1 Tax=Heliomicrobium undosum TaxID=121734 RepID=A0A845L6K2_9FIRM|nr:MFS transporter [Heliomicrobium undosum]